MRGIEQEGASFRHGFVYPPTTPLKRGGCAVVLYHEDGTTEQCPTGADIGDACREASKFIQSKYPGRKL